MWIEGARRQVSGRERGVPLTSTTTVSHMERRRPRPLPPRKLFCAYAPKPDSLLIDLRGGPRIACCAARVLTHGTSTTQTSLQRPSSPSTTQEVNRWGLPSTRHPTKPARQNTVSQSLELLIFCRVPSPLRCKALRDVQRSDRDSESEERT